MSVRCGSPLWLGVALAVILVMGAAAAVAQSVTRRFDIPADSVEHAIAEFARQSGLQIVASTRRLRGLQTPTVQGDFEPREALRRLIADTGLEIASDSGSVIVLRAAAPPREPVPAAPRVSVRRADSYSHHDKVFAEVVVTAEKRAESALTTPLSLTVYRADALKENQIHSLSDLPDIDPSINVNKSGLGDSITLRGVTSADLTSKGTPDIVFNIDGVPLSRGFEQAEPLFDLERVELLKGPQGTLYGASSTGGALNVISARPEDQFEATLDAAAGDFDIRRTTAVLNLPLSTALAVRAAVNYNYQDGYEVLPDGRGYTNGDNNSALRLSGLLHVTADMELLLQGSFGNVGGTQPGGVNYDTLLNAPAGQAQRTVYYDPYGQRVRDTFTHLIAQFNWAVAGVRLAYVGGQLLYSADRADSSTNNPLANDRPLYDAPTYVLHGYTGHYRTDSHELRVSNREPGALDWLVGGSWLRENIHEDDHYWSAVQTLAGVYPTQSDLVNDTDPLNDTVHTAQALFGQATWHAWPRLDLTVGLRDTWDALSRRGTFATGPIAGCEAPAACSGAPNNGAESDRKLTYRATIAYHFTPTQMLYASVASGFKGGGFNDYCGRATCPYQPEELVSYELGFKSRPLDYLEFSSDLFYYDFSAMQVPEFRLVNGNYVLFTGIYSTAIEGMENEIILRPTRRDQFHLNVTHLRSHFDSLPTYLPSSSGPSGPPANLAGHAVSATPTTAATLSYFHDFALPGAGTLRLHAALKFSSPYYEIQIAPFYPTVQPAFTRSNADIRYTSATGLFYLGAYVRNIENKMQITDPPADGGTVYPRPLPGAADVDVTDPRTWGLTAGLRW